MAWPVLLVMMMANMLLGKNVLLNTKNKAYIIGLEDNGRTTPEHGKDYKDYWGVNINVNWEQPGHQHGPQPGHQQGHQQGLSVLLNVEAEKKRFWGLIRAGSISHVCQVGVIDVIV